MSIPSNKVCVVIRLDFHRLPGPLFDPPRRERAGRVTRWPCPWRNWKIDNLFVSDITGSETGLIFSYLFGSKLHQAFPYPPKQNKTKSLRHSRFGHKTDTVISIRPLSTSKVTGRRQTGCLFAVSAAREPSRSAYLNIFVIDVNYPAGSSSLRLYANDTAQYTGISRKVVGGFEFTVLQRNLKEWHERPWTYVCDC